MAQKRKTALARGLEFETQALAWFVGAFPEARLLQRNFRTRAGEIDLIFECPGRRGLELVFVEVRFRDPRGWVSGAESVLPVKQRRLRRAMSEYLVKYQGRAVELRVDLLAWDGTQWEHRPGVWLVN